MGRLSVCLSVVVCRAFLPCEVIVGTSMLLVGIYPVRTIKHTPYLPPYFFLRSAPPLPLSVSLFASLVLGRARRSPSRACARVFALRRVARLLLLRRRKRCSRSKPRSRRRGARRGSGTCRTRPTPARRSRSLPSTRASDMFKMRDRIHGRIRVSRRSISVSGAKSPTPLCCQRVAPSGRRVEAGALALPRSRSCGGHLPESPL